MPRAELLKNTGPFEVHLNYFGHATRKSQSWFSQFTKINPAAVLVLAELAPGDTLTLGKITTAIKHYISHAKRGHQKYSYFFNGFSDQPPYETKQAILLADATKTYYLCLNELHLEAFGKALGELRRTKVITEAEFQTLEAQRQQVLPAKASSAKVATDPIKTFEFNVTMLYQPLVSGKQTVPFPKLARP